ncbi:MAG TPA: hypothetical protein VHV77_05895, partial [Pirellulales bacterium]|nr:hypothetical protein [Pirellulales bacterium]
MMSNSSRYAPRLRMLVGSVTLFVCLVDVVAADEDLPSAFACLPKQTCFMLRFPTPAASLKHFRETTRLGAVATDLKRWAEWGNLMFPAQADEFAALLKRYGLDFDNLDRCLDGEAG